MQVFTGLYRGGEAQAGDDADEAGWYTLADMENLPVIDSVLEVARELLAAGSLIRNSWLALAARKVPCG